jgi:NADH:ubiquinone oxidoreductase subunit F (NADH-binding)/ferredoxin
MVMAPISQVIRIGQPRMTAGLDRHARLDLAAHRAEFGDRPGLTATDLIRFAAEVDFRGRGGAGFPVSRKLQSVAAAARAAKRRPVVVVNATEGEPGSAKDKMLLSRSPHLILDGAVVAARALGAREIFIVVAGDGPHVQSVSQAARADTTARRMTRVVSLPDRFVSGESSAIINALNGKSALPSGQKTRTSHSGVRGLPTLLSNAETFAQLAILGMLGPAGYASVGLEDEPGTVLLTVGGSVTRPAVVEAPTGVPLGHILDICGARQPGGVLIGGYHGMWLTPEAADEVLVSRTGLAAAGGTFGAGVVLVLGSDTCPLGEASRIASYLAMQSSGQCGPCKLGLPSVARSLAAITTGSGGIDELEALRRASAGVRGRGACAHPDGTANFVASALDAFSADLSEHMFRGQCGRPVHGVLPVPGETAESDAPPGETLTVDWTRCAGHGLCARLVPELVQLDEHGFPEFLDAPVPFWLAADARQAVEMCPALALSLRTPPAGRPRPVALPMPVQATATLQGPARPQLIATQVPLAGSKRSRLKADVAMATEWIATIGGREQDQPPGPGRR